jgi:hypothetical protein
MRILPLFLACLLLSTWQCSSKTVPAETANAQLDWIVRYSRGPCFGQCPVFELYLAKDGTAILHARANMLEPGWYAGRVPRAEVKEVTRVIDPPGFWTKPAEDQPEIADLPSMHLVYRDGRTVCQLQAKGRMTDDMSRVFLMLDNMMAHTAWTPTDRRPVPWQETTDAIIVQLKPGVLPEVWLSEYHAMGLRLERVIAQRTGHYLFKLTRADVEPNDILQHVRQDPDVIGAQWDHPVQPRR